MKFLIQLRDSNSYYPTRWTVSFHEKPIGTISRPVGSETYHAIPVRLGVPILQDGDIREFLTKEAAAAELWNAY
ncbi:hypothetical protein [Acaryochloris thomasi]|uniref:hypothetical protein n=1 Tax=Acaryochloris thomasi TaxID=2929456 RepID=UPI000DA65C13|nr:hypothetical protein [Acaryochloris thomasi]